MPIEKAQLARRAKYIWKISVEKLGVLPGTNTLAQTPAARTLKNLKRCHVIPANILIFHILKTSVELVIRGVGLLMLGSLEKSCCRKKTVSFIPTKTDSDSSFIISVLV